MLLRKLDVERQMWGNNKGQLEGKITFDSEHGEVSVRLNNEQMNRILSICADALIEESRHVASAMVAPLIEAKAGKQLASDKE